MKEINSNNLSLGSIVGMLAAAAVILFLTFVLLKAIGLVLSALIPILVVVALGLVIYRLYQGKKLW